MCGRFTIKTPLKELVEEFDLDDPSTPYAGEATKDAAVVLEPRFNVAPTQTAPIVRVKDGTRRLALVRWGLVPSWSADLKGGARMINARSETVATQPAFRKAFAKRRCLVLADGFYEWRKEGKARLPVHIRRPDGRPFAMAGLWELWRGEDGPWVETCCVLTTSANERVATVHDRMPALLLEREAIARWLDESAAKDDLLPLLGPAPVDALELVRVATWVNDVRHEGPRCLEPPELDEGPVAAAAAAKKKKARAKGASEEQLDLFG